MIYVHQHRKTGEQYFAEASDGDGFWPVVDTYSGPLALERARAKYPKAANHIPLGEEGESDPSDFEEASQIEHAAIRLDRQHEPEDLKAKRLERERRRDDYLAKAKGELCGILGIFEGALNSGANQTARQALEELAQHHTDLENHIDGNG